MNRYFGLHTLEGEWHTVLPRYLLLAERVQGKRILDVGCGTGIGSSMLLELGAEMVDAVDHRPAVLELARMKHAKQGLDFHVMFWEELDFPDATFDLALCLDPSSPVTDPSLIEEIRRVLKPGGEYVCAIERKTIQGLESLLPRYGYTESAESVDLHGGSERVPQIGELGQHFQKVTHLVQRPHLSFVFDLDNEEEPAAELTRKIDEESGSGQWAQQGGSEQGRWLPVDRKLCGHEQETGSVELWFCGDESTPAPPLREVSLPYYSVVERLRQVLGDLQVRQMTGGAGDEDSLFEEVVEDPSRRDEEEGSTTSEFRAVSWEDTPTGVRERPDLDAATSAPTAAMGQHDAQMQEQLDTLYRQMRADFERVVSEARQALSERDRYIEHLVEKIQAAEARDEQQAGSPEEGLDREPTGVFDRDHLESGAAPQELGEESSSDGLDEESSEPDDAEGSEAEEDKD